MLYQNKLTVLLCLLIISGFFMFFMTYNSFMNDKKIIDSFDKDILRIYLFNRYENKFNYMHGLWLIPTGIFFVFLLVLLDIPSPEQIFKEFKNKIKKKEKKVNV